MGEKSFKRLPNFEGDEKMWKQWAEKKKMIVKTKSHKVFNAIEIVEKSKEIMTTEAVNMHGDFMNTDDAWLEKASAEIYEMMNIMMGGEALALVQSGGDMDGLAAWQRLHMNYNPKTRGEDNAANHESYCPTKSDGVEEIGH